MNREVGIGIVENTGGVASIVDLDDPLRQDSCTIIPEIHTGAVGATKCHVIQPKENTLY